MLSKDELAQVANAIKQAEMNTSGEIRVYVSRQCGKDPLEQATETFTKIGMRNTAQRNGVLIFISPSDKKVAIVGDDGIHASTKTTFWNNIVSEMLPYFRENNLVEGLCHGIRIVGDLIKDKYPYTSNDINELSDEVILEDE